MIYKIIKENCYTLTSQRLLKNKFTRVAGEMFSRYKVSENIQGTENITFSTTEGQRKLLGMNERFFDVYTPPYGMLPAVRRFTYYYNEIVLKNTDPNLGYFTSINPLPNEVSEFRFSFRVQVTTQTSLNDVRRIATSFGGSPTFSTDFSMSNLENARMNIGRATIEIDKKTSFSFNVVIRFISYIYVEEIVFPIASQSTTLNMTSPLQDVNLDVSVITSDMATFQIGSQNTRQEYPIQGNELLDSLAAFRNEDSTEIPLTARLASVILSNYKNGKQIIRFMYPLHSLKSVDGKNETNNINVGMYIQVFDDFGNAVYKYTNTDEPKIFEIVDCGFANEEWNIVAKEVAK